MTDTLSLHMICAPSEDVVAREIEGEIVIVPLASGIGDGEDELYSLNETGQAIWKHLDGARTLGAVVDALAQEFDAPRTELEADVLGFAGEMVRRGILVAKDDSR
jgi:hypothetical protein